MVVVEVVEVTDELLDSYDVVVVGGGAAGLNGALMLARSRRSVVVVDAGSPRNAPAEAVHGLFARDGMPPGELLALGRDEVRRYGGQVVAGEVAGVTRDGERLRVRLADGRSTVARRLLVTSGLVDELPDLPGLRERWGRDVVHCPYCHGWEVRDRAIGVLATGPMAVHQVLLFRQLSDDVVLFAHTVPAPTGEEARRLEALGVRVVEGEVAALEPDGLRLRDGALVPREVVVVAPRMLARADFLAGLGLRAVEHPSGAGEHVPADAVGRTGVPGVWVAGNVTDPMAQVGTAAAQGALAAAHLNAELVTQDAERALSALVNGRRPAAASAPGR